MVSRGFTGNARTLEAFRLRTIDAAWAAGAIAVAAALLFTDRLLGG
jgi:hypothetical protein